MGWGAGERSGGSLRATCARVCLKLSTPRQAGSERADTYPIMVTTATHSGVSSKSCQGAVGSAAHAARRANAYAALASAQSRTSGECECGGGGAGALRASAPTTHEPAPRSTSAPPPTRRCFRWLCRFLSRSGQPILCPCSPGLCPCSPGRRLRVAAANNSRPRGGSARRRVRRLCFGFGGARCSMVVRACPAMCLLPASSRAERKRQTATHMSQRQRGRCSGSSLPGGRAQLPGLRRVGNAHTARAGCCTFRRFVRLLLAACQHHDGMHLLGARKVESRVHTAAAAKAGKFD